MRLLCVVLYYLVLYLFALDGGCYKSKRRLKKSCGGTLTASHGVIQTPGFPAPFPVPMKCQWVIDATNIPLPQNASIVVYLTQLYVLKGLSFTEYAYYDPSVRYGERLIHTVTEQNVTKVRWIQPRTMFLVVDFYMKKLEGNQLRALDGLLDVYGFNITYEISDGLRAEPVRPNSCIVADCSFVGHCYAAKDHSKFWCSCFEGFTGPQCGYGPLCKAEQEEQGHSLCQNGATCRHAGANAITCYCPPGYNGTSCAIQTSLVDSINGCGDHDCVAQCPFDGRLENVCNCPQGPRIPIDRTRFEGTVRLSNVPSTKDSISRTTQQYEVLIERQLTKYLKNLNISRLDDFKILNISTGSADVTFHFFGAGKDGSLVRDALNRLVARSRLGGNLSFVPTHLAFHQEPSLLLQSVQVNRPRVIREGDEFIVSCSAQGSSYMTFQWYKDGIFVNTTKAIRKIWTHLQSSDTRDHYTAILGIAKATSLDEGVYTCQVEDWGIQQCKSTYIEVRQPPEVEVNPKSVTVQKGDNVSIVCISPNDRRPDVFGYNWTKNKLLFKMTAGEEVWEELYPAGSILKVTNVQKSAVYSCEVISYVTTTVDIRVEVLNKTVVPLCPEEISDSIRWPETSPGVYSITQCPPRFIGDARRSCTIRDVNEADWDLPDFSGCFADTLLSIHNHFRRLTYGYQNTSGPDTLNKYLHYLDDRSGLYPREGERILVLLQEIMNYMNTTKAYDEVHYATGTLYRIIDVLLKHEHSIMDIMKVMQLQRLLRSQSLLSGSLLKTSEEIHENLDTITVDIVNLNSSHLHNRHISLTQNSSALGSVTDKLDVRIESNAEIFENRSSTLAVIAYKNLVTFLPNRPLIRLRNGIDVEYEIISTQVISVALGCERGGLLMPPLGTIWLDMDLHHRNHSIAGNLIMGNATCAVAEDVIGVDSNWNLEACSTVTLNSTMTKCLCARLGAFALLIKTNPLYYANTMKSSNKLVLLLGCICCLILSSLAISVLLLYWWYYRSSLVYLKVQSCAATIGAMSMLLYALCTTVQAESFLYIKTFLEAFLLIGMSSHLSKLLIVYTELVQIPRRVRQIKPTVVGIITGVPVIAIFGNHLAHRSMNEELQSWWLLYNTLAFNIFVISSAVLFSLFVFLYFNVMRKLHFLINKNLITNNKTLNKRIGLLRRSALIFISMVVMITASILYVNVEDIVCHYVLSASCAILGLVQFFCYIIKCENSLRGHIAKKFIHKPGNNEDFSSESVNSPLSFFTKQDPDIENECIPPRLESSDGLLLAEQRKIKFENAPPSTIETYLHSITTESDLVLPSETQKDDEDVDLELYNSSPRKYRKSPISAALYTDSEKMYPEHWLVPVVPADSGQYKSHPPDILTTRVCVELDLVPNPVETPLSTDDSDYCTLSNSTVATSGSSGEVSNRLIQKQIYILPKKDQPNETTVDDAITESSNDRILPEEKTAHLEGKLDGMLDRITQDLDYLLNRSAIPEIQITPANLPPHGRKSKLSTYSVCGQIKEEDEEEET